MLLEPLGDPVELGVRLGKVLLHLRDLRRRADARDDVLALRVREVLAVEDSFAGVGIAGERDAGAGVVAHVPEHHRHDAARRPQVIGDLELLAVVLGALTEPRAEHGLDREAQLLLRLGRERLPGLLADDRLELVDELLELLRAELGIGLNASGFLLGFERVIELLRRDVEHDPAEHRDEPAVRIPREALVLREPGESLAALVVEAEIEDGIHHPRHTHRRA